MKKEFHLKNKKVVIVESKFQNGYPNNLADEEEKKEGYSDWWFFFLLFPNIRISNDSLNGFQVLIGWLFFGWLTKIVIYRED